ncbi:hypothetical protein M413DRAFT_30792 [Hebeloma cylindrosporum]|uniref:BTB domain-containing protein n=1 Tax=Hebeloma cylindrosporum TaxID=76867 RepID=A0A0C3C019_HEBCY|nr:hypothetical protein M413DRAFT_30792 [Hebeloma cylindrosporum h7]
MSRPVNLVLATPVTSRITEATQKSTATWQKDLELLFLHAKDRFPDVVWELAANNDDNGQGFEEVWGHKAIMYARAPPGFQNRYFLSDANSSLPGSEISDSTLSLGIGPSVIDSACTASPLPGSSHSTASTVPAISPLLRLPITISPSLFSSELEYLYTGKGFAEAFEFLFGSFETPEQNPGEDHDSDSQCVHQLRKDLTFMWRSQLYSDLRIVVTGNFKGGYESFTAIFAIHRFILVSRSPYFSRALRWRIESPVNNELPILSLPSPPFTPASLYFTLGFIYTGTILFSKRAYDLTTAFAIMKASVYLDIPSLFDEIQARIVEEMCHGLCHAFLPFPEYDCLTGGKWGTGGCSCQQCARRIPRVLEFALEDDVKNNLLERGARRALVTLFGEGWCTEEFASLSLKVHTLTMKGVGSRATPMNVFPLLFAAEHALAKLVAVTEPWGDTVRQMILRTRASLDELLCKESDVCFTMNEWVGIMEGNEDGDKVEWTMAAVLRGLQVPYGPSVYQTLVSILLRPHPTDLTRTLLSPTSHVSVRVNKACLEVKMWIGERWRLIRNKRGFDATQPWALKEISDYINVSTEDLLNPEPPPRPMSEHGSTFKVPTSGLRSSVLSVRLSQRPGTSSSGNGDQNIIMPSRSSIRSRPSNVRSVARTTASSVASRSTGSVATVSTAQRENVSTGNERVLPTIASLKDGADYESTPSSSSTPVLKSSLPKPLFPLKHKVGEQEDEERSKKSQGVGRTSKVRSVARTTASSVASKSAIYAATSTAPPENANTDSEQDLPTTVSLKDKADYELSPSPSSTPVLNPSSPKPLFPLKRKMEVAVETKLRKRSQDTGDDNSGRKDVEQSQPSDMSAGTSHPPPPLQSTIIVPTPYSRTPPPPLPEATVAHALLVSPPPLLQGTTVTPAPVPSKPSFGEDTIVGQVPFASTLPVLQETITVPAPFTSTLPLPQEATSAPAPFASTSPLLQDTIISATPFTSVAPQNGTELSPGILPENAETVIVPLTPAEKEGPPSTSSGSMFSANSSLLVMGGTFNNINTITTMPNDPLRVIRKAFKHYVAPNAMHDTNDVIHPPRCDPNTREAILHELSTWARTTNGNILIRYLSGAAGVGKSAIACSLAELLVAEDRLGASFFFNRAVETRNNERLLIPTIVFQLVFSLPELQPFVATAVDKNPLVFHQSLQTQIEQLMVIPFLSLDYDGLEKVIIVDGLDECANPEARKRIVEIVGNSAPRLARKVKFLILSRPGDEIESAIHLPALQSIVTSKNLRHFTIDTEILS